MISFLSTKVKSLYKYCAAATGTAFSPKFILDAKVQNSVFWKISYSGIFCNWVALNINLKSEWDFSNIKNFRKCKIKESGLSYKWNFVSSDNLGQKVGDKLTKLSKIGFSMECFTADFLQLFTKKCQNLAFGWTTGYLLSNPSMSGIFWKFPKILSLKSFGNSCTYFLVTIIWFRFTCGEEWKSTKKWKNPQISCSRLYTYT